ncbi:MAG: TRAP transporter large permease [Paralcaligenes sp.]
MTWLLFAGLAVLFMIGMPIGFAMMVASFLAMVTFGMSIVSMPLTIFEGTTSFVILAVPLFILMGELMSATSIAERLVEFASSLVGWMRGGLAHVDVVANMFMAEMSGSAVADAAALGKIFVPQMKRVGYPEAYAVSVTSAAAIIGIIIPPSIPMVLYGAITNTSIKDIFIAGIVPGIMLGVAFMITNYFFARRDGYPVDRKFELGRLLRATHGALFPLLIPIVVIGGMIGGIFTATEAAAIGVLLALVFGLARRELTFKVGYRLLLTTSYQTAAVMMVLAGSAILGYLLANEQILQKMTMAMGDLANTVFVFLLITNVILLLAGMFLQATAAIILIVPVLLPMALQLGIDPVHFAVITCVNLAVGQQTPPVATVLLTVCGVSDGVKMQDTFPYIGWYIFSMVIVLGLVTYVPYLTLWFK